MAMRHFLIGLGALAVALAVQVPPAATQPDGVIIGDDDLPNGAPVWSTAAKPKAVCYVGPANATPRCIFDTIPECRAACRTKRLHEGKRGRVQCMRNPELQQQRAQPASMKVDAPAPAPTTPRAH